MGIAHLPILLSDVGWPLNEAYRPGRLDRAATETRRIRDRSSNANGTGGSPHFRRLLEHLDQQEVQNIDLMNLAGFCRNCLSKWYLAAAEENGIAIDYETARERVYGMPYSEWKAKRQTPAPGE